jgi:hypothetical protein
MSPFTKNGVVKPTISKKSYCPGVRKIKHQSRTSMEKENLCKMKVASELEKEETVVNFVIGYDSLMNGVAKEKTVPCTGPNIPVRVFGYCRKFNCEGTFLHRPTTLLGVEEDPNRYFTGVAFSLLDDRQLAQLDEKEKYFYRQRVRDSQIQFLNGSDAQLVQRGNEVMKPRFWIYLVRPDFQGCPSPTCPILQTYLDIFVEGCLQIEETFGISDFTQESLCTTKGWREMQWRSYIQDRETDGNQLHIVEEAEFMKIDEALLRFILSFPRINEPRSTIEDSELGSY